jgi:hypothetical protein
VVYPYKQIPRREGPWNQPGMKRGRLWMIMPRTILLQRDLWCSADEQKN